MNYKTGLRAIQEMSIAGGAGNVFGNAGNGASAGSLYNVDSYAKGDARTPKVLGAGGNDPYENVDKGKKGKKRKSERKKLQSSVPVYRRTFAEMMTTESMDIDYDLNCLLYTEVSEYQQVISDILEKYSVTYECEENGFTFKGTDEHIQTILDKIEGIITEAFETGEVVALLGEMDININAPFKRPKKKPEDYDQEQLKRGIKVEHEHTDDKKVAALIAMNHLDEFPNYYSALDKMEQNLRKT